MTDGTNVSVASVYKATGLNAEEYEFVSRRKPLKKDTRYFPTCTLKGLSKTGEVVDELVYLFRWDYQSAFRTIELRLSQSATRERTIVAPEQLSFGQQGAMAYNHFAKKESDRVACLQWPHKLKSIDEVMQILGVQPVAAEVKSSSTAVRIPPVPTFLPDVGGGNT